MGVLNRDQVSCLRDLWDYLDTLPKQKLEASTLCFWLEALKDCFSPESNTHRAVLLVERKLYNGVKAETLISRCLLTIYPSYSDKKLDLLKLKNRLMIAGADGLFDYEVKIEGGKPFWPAMEHIF